MSPEPTPSLHPRWTIDRLATPAAQRDLEQLAALLMDAVQSGAAVTFLASTPLGEMVQWWGRVLGPGLDPRAIVLVARAEGTIVGTAQIQPAPAGNQRHRAEVCKMIVHRSTRGQGLGRALLGTLERLAAEDGFTLLTLDTKRGAGAQRLYESMGWAHTGTVPGYALDPDGRTLHDAAFYHKHIEPSA